MATICCGLVVLACHRNVAPRAEHASRAADIVAIREQFLERDRSFSASERAAAESLLSVLERRAQQLSDAAFHLAVAEVAAQANNGHTLLLNPLWTRRFNRLPVKFLMLGDGLWIAHAFNAEYGELVGAQVLSIDGAPLDSLRRAWRRYQGGGEGFRQQYLYYFIESPEVLHAAGIARALKSVTLTLRRDGRDRAVAVRARNDLPPNQGIESYLPPDRAFELVREHGHPSPPFYLQEPQRRFRLVEFAERDALYIQFRANSGEDEYRNIDRFVAEIDSVLRARPRRHVIVDQRLNVGGDLLTTRELMMSLPALLARGGHVYLLISERTFSAGIASSAFLKQAGGDAITILGESAGEGLEFWAEGGELVELDGGDIALSFATRRHNYVTGCPEDDCYAAMQERPIRIQSLEPEHRIAPTFADFRSGRDPVLDSTFALIALRTRGER